MAEAYRLQSTYRLETVWDKADGRWLAQMGGCLELGLTYGRSPAEAVEALLHLLMLSCRNDSERALVRGLEVAWVAETGLGAELDAVRVREVWTGTRPPWPRLVRDEEG